MGGKGIAVVTGANGGLGKEFVKRLNEKPEVEEIWAVARNEKRLAALKEELGDRIKPIALDLTVRGSIGVIADLLKEEHVRVRYLVNNAGFAKFCSYGDIDVEESLNMIDLNVGAVVAVGLVCIPYMGEGSRIINIASQASFQPLPYQNIYSSTKAFVRNYTRALNVELGGSGISATAVCPGWMKTGLFERGLVGASKGTNNFSGMVTPDKVAAKALRDAERGRDQSVYGLTVKMSHALAKLLPQRAMMKIWLAQQKIQ